MKGGETGIMKTFEKSVSYGRLLMNMDSGWLKKTLLYHSDILRKESLKSVMHPCRDGK